MPRFGEVTDRGPIWEIVVGDGDPYVFVVGYSESNANLGPTVPDAQVKDFAQAIADAWGLTVQSVTRSDTAQTVLP